MSVDAIGALAPEPMDTGLPVDSSKPIGLHSPPDSNNSMDVDGSDSELSDLDEVAHKLGEPEVEFKVEPKDETKDELKVEPEAAHGPEPQPPVADDIGEILPDHWSGNVPVFKPTMKQFQDFKLFMEKVDKYGMKSGIIKIIAPEEWKASLGSLDERIKHIRVREPIKQDIMGSNGTYRQVNFLHQRSYNLPQWKQLCEQSEHQPPARRGERRANSDRKPATRTRAAASSSSRNTTSAAPARKRRGRVTRRSARAARGEAEEREERPMTPVSPAPEKEDVLESVEKDPGVKEEEQCDGGDSAPATGRMGFSRQSKPKTQSTSARRKYSRREGSAMIDEAAFKDFDYRMDISEFTPERCEELEKIYWKTLTYAPPLYGADLLGTLFDDSTKIWNLNKLPNLLDVLGTKVPGVNTAYLYLGMWKATFAWHLEDVDLYSINYLHFGAPKQWYAIAQADARRFEAAMKNIWPTEAKACDQFLRHKSFLISPSHLKQHYNITVNKCVSYPGEFVVTYPYGYHSGFNLGYNCAEAVNFALDSWLPMGKIAKKCQCAQAQDSVWVDVYEIERKLRGEETEYEETEDEEEDEDEDEDEEGETGLLSPPSSHTVRVKPGRKRKRGTNEKEPKTKTKRIRLRLKAHAEPPCCLCPNDIPGAEIMDTDDGRKAHRMCALYLPETYIETVDGKEIVANVAGIDKARLELKCLYCRSKKGACFQCSQKKCPRAYHATCAAAAGVFVEEGEVPVFGEDGKEYKEQAFEFSCRFHRTKRDRKIDGDALENNPQVREAAMALKKNDICQLQYYRGEIFAGVVVENRVDEEALLLDIIPNGDRVEVEWKWLLLPDPADFRLPKASANALPMPTCRKAQREINAKRADDEAPRRDDEFAPGFVWAEFHIGDLVRNREQAKVDLSKENQVWHYLGKTSTEAKAQYTEDPARPWHNPKGNFLDTIPKPAPPVRMPMVPQQRFSLPGTYPGQTPNPVMPTTTARQVKPYVYKPRQPVTSPTTGPHSAPFTSHTFSVMTPSSPGFQPHQPQQLPQRPQPQQPTFQHHVFPRHNMQLQQQQQQQQRQQQQQQQQQPQTPLQVKQYQAPGLDARRRSSSTQYSSDRFAPVRGGNGFPQLPGLTWPPAHMKSGQSYQPQARAWPLSAEAAAQTPPPVPMTSSALRPPSVGNPQSAAGGQPHVSAYQKYSFFQVNHNRDSSRYRTPYGPWGGFTNGYEGNLREFLLKAQKALSGGDKKAPIPQVPASLLQPLQPRMSTSPAPGASSPAGHASPYTQILPRPPPQTPSPAQPMGSPAATPAQPYQKQAYPDPTTPNGHTASPSLHPAIRPQYGAAWPQQPSQPSQHGWPATPLPTQVTAAPTSSRQSQPPVHAPISAKPAFTKQSHSPIPLPPYVRQMAAPAPSDSNNPKHTPQVTASSSSSHLPSPETPSAAPAAPLQQQEQSQQQFVNGSQGGVPAGSQQAYPSPPQHQGQQGVQDQEDSAALVEKMMVHLRRASQNIGSCGGVGAAEGGDAGGGGVAHEQSQTQQQSQSQPRSQPQH